MTNSRPSLIYFGVALLFHSRSMAKHNFIESHEITILTCLGLGRNTSNYETIISGWQIPMTSIKNILGKCIV